jgi:hypothetical protein
MLVHVVNGATALSHLTTLPVLPDKVNVPLVAPEQMVVPPLTEPPTLGVLTLTTTESELTILQVLFCTTARNAVDCINAPVFNDVVVLEIFDHEVNGATALCHLNTFPVFPPNDNEGPELPEQTGDAPPEIVPGKVCGVTFIDIVFDVEVGEVAQSRLEVT